MTVSIDGVPFEATGTLLHVIVGAGIHLPHLCKDDNLPAIGACRTCMVEADGRIVAACSTLAASVREVSTTGERPTRIRQGVLELTAGMHNQHDGNGGPHSGTTAEAIRRAEADRGRYPTRTGSAVDASNPFFSFHEESCILCGRCVTACQALQHIGAIGLAGHGAATRVTPGAGDRFLDSICTSCGSCVASCPTHALRPKFGGL